MFWKKHRRRFGLRTLLLLVTVSGALLGQFSKHCMNNRAELSAEREIRRVGGVLVYSSSFDPQVLFQDGNQLQSVFLRFLPLFRTVAEVRMTGCDVTEASLKQISKLRHVRRISLGRSNTNGQGLAHLASLHNLEQLDLQSTNVRDASLVEVARIKNLSYLNLGYTGVTDEGLSRLHCMRNLEQLGLAGTQVTPTGIARISKAIPKLSVYQGTQKQSAAPTELTGQVSTEVRSLGPALALSTPSQLRQFFCRSSN